MNKIHSKIPKKLVLKMLRKYCIVNVDVVVVDFIFYNFPLDVFFFFSL